MSECPQCHATATRSGMGFDLHETDDTWLCDVEYVACPICGYSWLEVVKECRQWRQASRQAGRSLPYRFDKPSHEETR